MKYEYSDGNGNLYRLNVAERTLTYDPVQVIESSSGLYSGGEPGETKLTKKEVAELVDMLEAAFRNKTFRIPKRNLGSAQIRRLEPDEDPIIVILAMRSPDKSKIEKWLEERKFS